MSMIDLLNAYGYVKNLFPFDRSQLNLMREISELLGDLTKNQRKNIFAFYPNLKEIISQGLKNIQIDCKLTNYCFYIEKSDRHNWSLGLHQDVNFPDYLRSDETSY